MNTKQDATTITNIMAALNAYQHAKQATPEDNPLNDRSLDDLKLNAGVLKDSDKVPAKTMANESESGFLMEVERTTALKEEKNEKVNQRRARQRRIAERKMAFDRIADAPVKPDKARLEAAWFVVHPLVPIITKIAVSKQRWAARFLGSLADDVPSIAMEKIALVLAKGDKDLVLLRVAAEQLGGLTERSGLIPGDQASVPEGGLDHVHGDTQCSSVEAAQKRRKAEAKSRKWLMGLVNNRVMGAIVDLYTDEHNLRWDNIDLIATTMANVNGVGDDPMTARFKADRTPAFIATRFQAPGQIDANVLAMAITGAITALSLDPIVEILLNDDNRRVNGSVKWAHCAQDLFLASPGGDGAWMWDTVCKATEHLKRPRHARANAARVHVRGLFEWLPFVIANVVASLDLHLIGWSPTDHKAVMASDFELYYSPSRPESEVAVPSLRFASIEEAACILAEVMGEIPTAEEYLREATQ